MIPKFRAWDKEQEIWINIANLNFDEFKEFTAQPYDVHIRKLQSNRKGVRKWHKDKKQKVMNGIRQNMQLFQFWSI